MRFVLYPLALALTCVTPPVLSQGNRYIDTEQQCLKIHGTWTPSKYGLRGQGITMKSCYVDMNPYGECRQAGGHSIDNAPDEIRCQLPHSELGKMAQCRENQGLWAKIGQSFLCYLEAAEKKCRQEGGNWDIGLGDQFYCFKTAIDGGKPCMDSSDCQFACLYTGPPLPVGEQVAGKCQSSNRSSGECYSRVTRGKLDGYMCP